MATSALNNHFERRVTNVKLMTKPDGTICILTRTFDGHEHHLNLKPDEARIVSDKLAARLSLWPKSTIIEG